MSGGSNLPRPRDFVSFYKLQFETLWEWRPTPAALVKRIILSFVVSAVALWLTTEVMPGVTLVGGLRTLILAVVILGALDLLIRPLILGMLAGISVILVAVATLVFQVLAFLIVSWLVPSFEVRGPLTAFVGSIVYAFFPMILSAVLGTGGDESYWSTLVQQLAARGRTRSAPTSRASSSSRSTAWRTTSSPTSPGRPRPAHGQLAPRRRR